MKPDLAIEDVFPYLRLGPEGPDARIRSRVSELLQVAPISPKSVWCRVEGPSEWSSRTAYLMCGTIGAAFDAWQRRLAATSASDAFLAQAIGAAAVEAVMDATEGEIRATVPSDTRFRSRWSPGYGACPLARSREILAQLNASRRLGVTLTESCLLLPTKSVTAVYETDS